MLPGSFAGSTSSKTTWNTHFHSLWSASTKLVGGMNLRQFFVVRKMLPIILLQTQRSLPCSSFNKVILPKGQLSPLSLRFFGDYVEYWKHYEPYILHFAQKVIPDVHICSHDYFGLQTCFLSITTQAKILSSFTNTCLQISQNDLKCKLLLDFAIQNHDVKLPNSDEGSSYLFRPNVQILTTDLCTNCLHKSHTHPVHSDTDDVVQDSQDPFDLWKNQQKRQKSPQRPCPLAKVRAFTSNGVFFYRYRQNTAHPQYKKGHYSSTVQSLFIHSTNTVHLQLPTFTVHVKLRARFNIN